MIRRVEFVREAEKIEVTIVEFSIDNQFGFIVAIEISRHWNITGSSKLHGSKS